jgi:hypothetical protein
MRQWDALMGQAARMAKAFDPQNPEIRPEFVVAALPYVERAVCERVYECMLAEEPNFHALFLSSLAEGYKVPLPKVLSERKTEPPPEVGLDEVMQQIVRAAKRHWREKKSRKGAVPVDYLLATLLSWDDELPVLDLCLMDVDLERDAILTYLLGSSKYLSGSQGTLHVQIHTFDSLSDMAAYFDGEAKREARTGKKKPGTPKAPTMDDIEAAISARVIGQPEAVAAVMRALKKHAAGLKEEQKPIAVLLFAGPTGVGKTELARVLANVTGWAFKRYDMSEYSEKHEMSRLYGSPPGYVGYEEGGQMTKFVAANPRSIIAFDEVDKAHPDIMNVLLQIAEEGALTDGQGKTVNFSETVIILTTNIGAKDAARQQMGFGGSGVLSNHRAASFKKALEEFFRPELRGRMTDIVIFNDLSSEQIRTITRLEVAKLNARILKSRGIILSVADDVLDFVAAASDVAQYGARELKSIMDKRVAEPLADFILRAGVATGAHVLVARDGDVISMKVAPPPGAVGGLG